MTTLRQYQRGEAKFTKTWRTFVCGIIGHRGERYGDAWLADLETVAVQYQCRFCKKFYVITKHCPDR